MSSLTLDRDAKIKEFAEDCGYKVGINCNESARNAAFELYELRVNGGSSIINFLKIIYKYLDGESKRMPLTPLSQRGLEKFIDCNFITGGRVLRAVKTLEGRIEIMKVLWKLAQMKQYMLLKKSLLWGGKGEPPAGYTLYRSKQKDAIMALINSLPKREKNELLHSVWSYYCRGGDKIGGEVIFGNQHLMPL